MTSEEIRDAIVRRVGASNIANWYVGIASDARSRLFDDHSVNENSDGWCHGQALNDRHARTAESSLLDLGFDGGRSGGDHTTVHVYAFRKDPGTVR